MKLILSLVFILTYTQGLKAQGNYIQYHREILNCETQFLFKENIRDAIKDYKLVLDRYSKPFAKDCFIALQLACFANDTENARYFFRKSFQRGVDWIAITKSKCISNILTTDAHYKQGIEVIYEQEHKKFLSTIDTNLRKEVINMKYFDGTYKLRINHLPKGAERDSRDSAYINMIRKNTERIIELTKVKGV